MQDVKAVGFLVAVAGALAWLFYAAGRRFAVAGLPDFSVGDLAGRLPVESREAPLPLPGPPRVFAEEPGFPTKTVSTTPVIILPRSRLAHSRRVMVSTTQDVRIGKDSG